MGRVKGRVCPRTVNPSRWEIIHCLRQQPFHDAATTSLAPTSLHLGRAEEMSNAVQVLLVGAIAAVVGIAAITVLGETVSGEFSNIYGSPLQANPQP